MPKRPKPDTEGLISGWATHQHALIACVMNTTGPVLELGCGYYSTPILHEICKAQGRMMASCEFDEKWINRFKHLSSKEHTFTYVDIETDWGLLNKDVIAESGFSVIFVDHSPANRRQIEIERLKDSCEFMVVHDTDKMKWYGYDFSMFKYVYTYTLFKKTTTILSQTRDPKELFE